MAVPKIEKPSLNLITKAIPKTEPVRFATFQSAWGTCLIAQVQGAICALGWPKSSEDQKKFFLDIQKRWKGHTFIEDPKKMAYLWPEIIACWEGICKDYPIALKGTSFELETWKALSTVRRGESLSYQNLAEKMGHSKKSARPIGNAVGKNPVSLLIPCHRIIRTDRSLGGYRWGTNLKSHLLSAEGVELSTSKSLESQLQWKL